MKKTISVIIIMAMLLTLAACGNTGQGDEADSSEGEYTASNQGVTTLSGTVSSVDGYIITVTTEDGSGVSFTVNDSTEYSAEMSETPSGESQQGGTPPEMPTGDAPESGATPEMPSDDSQQGGMPPEMPTGDVLESGATPERPSGERQQGGTAPGKPTGEGQQGGTPPEMPTGEGQQGGTAPDIQQNDEDRMQFNAEMLTVGTSVTVTVSSDGIAVKVVFRMGGNHEETGDEGGNVSIVGMDGTVYVSGDSNVTVTVDSFSDSAELSDCGTVSSFSDYYVSKI